MEFLRITLKDFRQYFGTQEIKFAKGSHKNVTVVNGPNGAGKTSLFSAINWCLYNEGVEQIGALVSKEAALEKEYGDILECSVKIWFEHEGSKYVATRIAKERKVPIETGSEEDEDGEEKYKSFTMERLPAEEADFVLLGDVDGNMKEVPDPNRLINSVLPKNARQYFLFDGEKIEQLTRPDHDNEIKEAIRNILQLPSIENAREHLGIVIREFTKESKKSSSGNESELYEKIEKLENEIVAIDTKLEAKNKELVSTRDLKQKVEEDLRKLEAIKHLIARRDELEREYEEAKDKRNKWKSNLRNSLSSSYLIVAEGIINKCSESLKEKKEKGLIPPLVQNSFIEKLLVSDSCICGNDICAGSEGHKNIKMFLEKCKEYNKAAQDLSDLNDDLGIISNKAQNFAENIKMAMREVSCENQNIELTAKRLEDLHKEIEGHKEEDISQLEKSRKKLEDDEDNIRADIATLNNDKARCQNEIKDHENEIEKISKKKDAARKFIETRKLSEKALEVLNVVYEKFASEKRIEIEKFIKKVFDLLIWKDSIFTKVRLSDDYKLEVFDHYGSPAREELSAGERQVLSLSFIASMAQVSGGDVPLVMDTPFGRLFSIHRENIVEQIPKLTKQLILMVQDEELKGKAKTILQDRVGEEYNLIFENGCTRIEVP